MAKVMLKYREWRRRDKTLTEEQFSIKVAGFFNYSSDISRGYKRLTFDSLTEPLATKQGISSSSPAARKAAPKPPAPAAPTRPRSTRARRAATR